MAVEEKSNDIQAISEKRTHSVQEIADILQISRSMAYNLCRQQLFKTVKIGKYVEYPNPPLINGLITKIKKENQHGIYCKKRQILCRCITEGVGKSANRSGSLD
ncbi:MAG: helix-turn-helix domain-containing protein [Enterocloster clostridioformis]